MNQMLGPLWPLAASLGSIALLTCFVSWREKRSKSRRPIEDKVLRSAGASLSARLEDLQEASMLWVATVCFGPMLLWQMLRFQQPAAGVMLPIVVIGICLFCLFRNLEKMRNIRLGIIGERAVGEELNRLMLEGCHIFHDFPAGSNWNIDHVVVAPSGVYAIETKARRKRALHGKKDHEVTFDGTKLFFPGHCETAPLEQADRNAVDLARVLSKATAEPVTVQPILAIPGWFIERTGKGKVSVLNPKEIRTLVISGYSKRQLAAKQIQRIASFIEEKCRDIDL